MTCKHKPIKVFVGGLGGGVFQKEPLKVFDFTLLIFVAGDKAGEGAVVGSFHVIGEAACWQFLASQVVLQAFAADSFAAAGFIAAIASAQIKFLVTFFHHSPHFSVTNSLGK